MSVLDALLQPLTTLPAWITLLIGVVALLGGGALLVEGAVGIARQLGIPPLIVGLTVVAFGTSAPELAFNITAAVDGHPQLSFGNVIGSNIANIGLVLGLSAIVRPLVVLGPVLRRELPILVAVTALTCLLAWTGDGPGDATHGFSRIDGVVFIAGFGIVAWTWVRAARAHRDEPLTAVAALDVPAFRPRSTPLSLGMMLGGLVLLPTGGEITQIGAIEIATSWGWSEAVVGLTVVAIATSLPEVTTSMVAAVRGHTDLAVGNVVGSNLFNILLVLGVTSAIAPVDVPEPGGWWDLAILGGLTLLLVPLARTNGRIGREEGILLVAAYIIYVAVLLQ